MTTEAEVRLALETATPAGSVAVGRGDEVLAEVMLGTERRHAEALLPAVKSALEQADLDASAIGAVVVGAGPGSFTGVRIAAATAKGLVHALGVPLFAYSSLAAVAAGAATGERALCALFDARRDEVYAACYRFGGPQGMITEREPAALRVGDVLALTRGLDPIYIGDGALANADRIRAAGGTVAPAPLAQPRASSLLWLARVAPGSGRIPNAAEWQPDYVRPPGAERWQP